MSQSLGTAQLSPEASAFLRGGDGAVALETRATPAPEAVRLPGESVWPVVQAGPRPPAAQSTVAPTAAAAPRATAPMPTATGSLVSLTFRLPASLADTLLRVSLNRKLRKEKPFAQQDIVAEAVREWLERKGAGAPAAEGISEA